MKILDEGWHQTPNKLVLEREFLEEETKRTRLLIQMASTWIFFFFGENFADLFSFEIGILAIYESFVGFLNSYFLVFIVKGSKSCLGLFS